MALNLGGVLRVVAGDTGDWGVNPPQQYVPMPKMGRPVPPQVQQPQQRGRSRLGPYLKVKSNMLFPAGRISAPANRRGLPTRTTSRRFVV